jgi:hypothetical protein
VLNLVETNRCIGIATVWVAKMLSWGRVGYLGASMGSGRPNNQRMETPTVCRNALYCCDQRMFYASSPIRLKLIPTYKDLERVENA